MLREFSITKQLICLVFTIFIPLFVFMWTQIITSILHVVILLAIGLLVAFLVGRNINKKIERVVQGHKEIEAGNLAYRLEKSSETKYDPLIDSFNMMAEQLQDEKKLFYGMHDELERRINERNVQIASTNHELESFSYSVSHDLRAPLRHIDAYTRIILEEHNHGLDEDAKNYLLRIHRSIGKMTGLIEALLSLAGLARLDVHRELLDLSAMSEEIAADLQSSSPVRSIEFIIQKGIIINADARLIRIVMENLMGNACKYTGRKDRAVIEVGSGLIEGKVAYYVRDNGAGFDMAYATKLFTPFQRLHTEKEFEGTGIGLTTVQRIIHRHLGIVWAEALPGVGATFRFTLH